MKLRNIIQSIAMASASLFAVTSCNGLLDIPQHSVSSIDSYYKTDAEAEEGITECYGAFRALEGSTNSLQFVKEMLSDNVWCGGGSHYDGNFHELTDYTFSSDYGSISSIYTNLYTLIYDCNVVIENVTGTSDVMKRAVAEAKVFRAWANFQLVTLWGTAPLVQKTLEESEYMQGNSTKEALWSAIETDLTEAISSGDLVVKSGLGDKTYRITKQFAQAMLGKAYLFQKKNPEAAAILNEVIDSKLYDLNPDLSNAGTPLGGMTMESIFEIHCINDPSNNSTNNNFKWTFQGLRGEKYAYDNPVPSPFARATFGYINPKKDLYDAFVSVEGTDGYRLRNTIATYDQMVNDYGTKPIMEITDNEGYWNFKYRILGSRWAGYFYANNTRIMKFNEVLLLAAEANLLSGNASLATSYINRIRTRAQAPLVTGDVTMDQIKVESRLELCFEGQRYENIIRWGDAAKLLEHAGEKNPALQPDGSVKWESYNDAGKCGFVAGKHELWPFPATEMQVNPNMTQNDKW